MNDRNRSDVLDEWTVIIENAAAGSERLVDEIEEQLASSEIAGLAISRQPIAGGEMLLLEHERLHSIRHSLVVRPYGRHLEVRRSVEVRGGVIRRVLAWILGVSWVEWSRPRRKLEDELKSSIVLLHHTVLSAARRLGDEFAVRPKRRRLQDVLGAWQ